MEMSMVKKVERDLMTGDMERSESNDNSCLELQRPANVDGEAHKNKKKAKKAKKEKARAVSDTSSSESSSDSEEERKKRKKNQKKSVKKEKTRANKHKPSSSEDDSTDSGQNPADSVVNLSSSSSASTKSGPEQVAEVKQAAGKPGTRGIQWSARGAPVVQEPMKPATLMKSFRIPKQGEKSTPVERKAAQQQAKSRLKKDSEQKKSVSKEKKNENVSESVREVDEKKSRKLKKSWSENVTVNGKALKMKVDSGSTVTILTWRDFCRLGLSEDQLEPTRSTIVTYSGNQIIPLGKMKARMSLRGNGNGNLFYTDSIDYHGD
jgi:hypothetical protein